jgi:hypothetical protein
MSVQICVCGYGSKDMEVLPSWQFNMPDGFNTVNNHLKGISVGRVVSYAM